MAETTKVAQEKKKKSGNGFFKKIGNFFKEYKSEMKKVVWYPFKSVVRDTGICVAALVASGVVIGVLDLAFSELVVLLSKLG